MMKAIVLNDEQLRHICEQFGVRELYAFGSVLTDNNTDQSDIDIQVIFEKNILDGAFDMYMGLKQALELKYHKKVDLISGDNFRNPIFKDSLNKSKKLIYAS